MGAQRRARPGAQVAEYDDGLAFEADVDATLDDDRASETDLSLLEALSGRVCHECGRDLPLAAFPHAAHGMAGERGHTCEECAAKHQRAKRAQTPVNSGVHPKPPSAEQMPEGWRALQTTARPSVLSGKLSAATTAEPATIREAFAPQVWEAVAAHTRRIVEETAAAVAREMAAAAIREATRDAVRAIVRELLLCADRLMDGEGREEGGAAHVHD